LGIENSPGGKSATQVYIRNEKALKDWKPGQWNHVGFAWEKKKFAKAYVNGISVGQIRGEFLSPDSFSQLALGKSGELYAQSVIRDVRISRRPITDTEMHNWFSPAQYEVAGDTLIPFAKTKTSPIPNGRIANGEYSSEISGFVDVDSMTPDWEAGQLYTAMDEQFIYVAASLELPKEHVPFSKSAKRDDPSLVSEGDLFVVLLDSSSGLSPKHIQATYMTVAPNGTLFDAQEDINWESRAVQRDSKWNSKALCKSRVRHGHWTVELKLPRKTLKIPLGTSFRMSVGFKLGARRFGLVSHPEWFNHYQAFVKCKESPIGVQTDWEGLKHGMLAGETNLSNNTINDVKSEISVALRSPTIKKTAKGMVVEQMIDEEIHVSSGGVLWEDKKEIELKSSGSGSVQFEHSLSSPNQYLLEEKITISGTPIYHRHTPFSFYPPLSLELRPIPSMDSIRAIYRCTRPIKEQKKSTLEISFMNKHTVSMQRHVRMEEERGEAVFSIETLLPGTYSVQAKWIQESGDVLGAVKIPFTKRDVEAWRKNPVGLEALEGDWVPNPWIPLERNGDAVSLWGRNHDYHGPGILKQIRSQGKKLLSDAMKIKYHNGKKENVPAMKTVEFPDDQPGRIKIIQRGGDEQLDISVAHEIEFDGFNKIDVRIAPSKPSKVDRLWIDIPFKHPRFQYVKSGDHKSYRMGEVQEGSWNDFPLIWIGDDDVGCFVFSESFRGWQSNSKKPRVTLVQKGKDFVLKLWIVNEPMVLKKPLEFTFGIQAGPVKPFFQGWRALRPQGWGWAPQPVNLFMVDPRNWSSTYSRPVPLNWRRMNDMVTHVHKDKQRVYPYLTPFSISTYDIIRRDTPVFRWKDKIPPSAMTNKKKDSQPVEEYWYHAEDWDLVPRRITGDGTDNETTEMAYVDPDSSWTDYFVGSIYEILERTDIDGLYFDLPYPRENRNRAKNLVSVTRDGVEEGTYQYFAARNLYKRLYWAFEKLRGPKRKPYILGHSGRYFFPLSSFWDVEFHGEEVKPAKPFEFTQWYLQKTLSGAPSAKPASADAPRSYDALAFRCSYGQQFGIPQMLLPQYGHRIPALPQWHLLC